MNDLEREVIILNSAWEMIDKMINKAMFINKNYYDTTELRFQTDAHEKIFIILLGDFLSQVKSFDSASIPLGLKAPPSNASPSDRTFLFHLKQVCNAPEFGENSSRLEKYVHNFAEWLECTFVVPGMYLANIQTEVNLKIDRYSYIRMCGDIAKHHLGRLAYNVEKIRKILNRSSCKVSEHEAYSAVDSFFEWYFDNIFYYHSNQIAEFLNNIRWEIYEYLGIEYRRSWYETGNSAILDIQTYSYRIPEKIKEPIAINMYWDLMNRVRARPFMPRFKISDILKNRY